MAGAQSPHRDSMAIPSSRDVTQLEIQTAYNKLSTDYKTIARFMHRSFG